MPPTPSRTRVGTGLDGQTARRSGSVDMLGPVCSVTSRPAQTRGSFAVRMVAGTGAQYVLPRKEVIQPQLPLRLPCSRGSPCRHGAWTISSSWLPTPESGRQQTALPWMPRSHTDNEVPVRTSRNIEPPDRMIRSEARPMQLPACNPFIFKDRLQGGYI